ncbi:ABC transporter ATP-binding protein [Robiginitalea myxolifaciens]|uniref:ABC transporter ATP-binding protein n=1 Tax=Robiginitalea myxolifaciens TaxID=400055 RepID=UPI001FEB3CAF|nr:ABC transporter ATP-binding protein [Robiginitalea myxolifaciens]
MRIGYSKPELELGPRQGLDFELQSGSLTAIIGINGVGKSTLLRTLAGLQPALGGVVKILGNESDTLSARQQARQLSVVLTNPPASRNLSVRDLIALGRHPYTNWLGQLSALDEQCIADALKLTALESLAQHPCHSLSDGQLQRVLIARALAQQTPLVLLDEPTSHLDLHHKVRILKLLRDISRQPGKAVVFTTHEIDLALQLCTHMLVLFPDNYAFGTPQELIKSKVLESLFPSDSVTFDTVLQRFNIS